VSKRGVIYMMWGNSLKVEMALHRSMTSVEEIHPELPIEVIRVEAADAIEGYLQKARMFEHSPFEETLFLDADTVVLGRLDFGFQKAQKFGIACSICECPWARRHAGGSGDLVEYNSGVLFFTKNAKPVFDTWADLAPRIDSSIVHIDELGQRAVCPYADQLTLSLALEQHNFNPFVLPMNWNYRPPWNTTFFGPVKVWHSYADVPPGMAELNRHYENPESIIQFHEH
jgi:hypothetical protein